MYSLFIHSRTRFIYLFSLSHLTRKVTPNYLSTERWTSARGVFFFFYTYILFENTAAVVRVNYIIFNVHVRITLDVVLHTCMCTCTRVHIYTRNAYDVFLVSKRVLLHRRYTVAYREGGWGIDSPLAFFFFFYPNGCHWIYYFNYSTMALRVMLFSDDSSRNPIRGGGGGSLALKAHTCNIEDCKILLSKILLYDII